MDGVTNGFRTMRGAAIGLVALLALGLCAATARAESLSMEFTEARANVGVQLSDHVLFGAGQVAEFDAQIDSGGLITAGLLTVPAFSTHITDPLDADVTVEFEIGPITGSFDQATGALTGTGTAGGTLTSEGSTCIISTTPAPLTLSTAGNSGGTGPRSGTPFTSGLTGAGAVAGQWTDMHATPVGPGDNTVCDTVDDRIGGPGGIWLYQEGDTEPPPAPQLSTTDPASPNANGTPRIRGTAEAGSTVKVYAGPDCTGAPVANGSAAELASPGLTVTVAEGVTATFSATASDAAGNASACSGPISYTRVKTAVIDPPPPPAPKCVVPKLAGKTLKQAKRALKAANCKLGEVQKPKQAKGKKRRVLVVKRSFPGRGAKPADRTVDLKLHPKPKPKPKVKQPKAKTRR
jgi:hypothetical protein